MRTRRPTGVEAREVLLRRRSAACSLSAAGILGFLSLYQLGIIRRLPDLPYTWADANLVDGAGEAYWLLSAADAPIGMCNFALTVALATNGPADRVQRRPWIPVAWTAKAAVDAAYAIMLAVEQPTRYKRLCVYCLAVTLFALGGVTAAAPEGARAWRRLRAARQASRVSGRT